MEGELQPSEGFGEGGMMVLGHEAATQDVALG
jgi:hypothetical protein